MNNQNQYEFTKASEEKHMVYGPAIIPDKHILQYDDYGNPYYLFFSKETTEKLAQNFLKNFGQKAFTFQHNEYLEGATLVEQWIISDEEKDKANLLKFKLPVGTWMMGVKIDNLELWEKIKNETVKGLSIEAYMVYKVVKNSIPEEEKVYKKVKSIVENLNENNSK
jgi:hypothetical protein